MSKTTSNSPMERRAIAPSELRSNGDGKITGYAAVFNTLAEDGWGGMEQVRAGAFKKTLAEKEDIRALWNHDTNLPLGRTTIDTLTLWEDKHGLAFELTPPDTQWGRDARESIRTGLVSQMSFGFHVHQDQWTSSDKSKSGNDERELIEIELFEVSPVTFPFYPTTEVGVRSAMEKAGAESDLIERTIGELGYHGKTEEQAETTAAPQNITILNTVSPDDVATVSPTSPPFAVFTNKDAGNAVLEALRGGTGTITTSGYTIRVTCEIGPGEAAHPITDTAEPDETHSTDQEAVAAEESPPELTTEVSEPEELHSTETAGTNDGAQDSADTPAPDGDGDAPTVSQIARELIRKETLRCQEENEHFLRD